MRKGIMFGILAGAVGFAAAAVAQNNFYPGLVQSIGPTDTIPILPGGQPSAQQKYAVPAQITSQMGYQKVSPVTGFTYTFGNSQSLMIFTGAVTPLSGTVTFAAAPSDGANECIFAQGGISTLVLAAGSTSQTIRNTITSLAALTKACYLFSSSTGQWDRN